MIAHEAQRVFRLDLSSGEVGERRRTPQGGLIANANLTKTGVFSYRTASGKMRRELRHPSEVFHPDSLATYPLAPVTVDHPGRVGPSNWKTHAVGTVGADVRANGHFVSGDIHLQHGDAIDRAESGDLREISCGYQCEIDPTAGVYEGQPYDVQQRKIRINHVALGPRGWGRMGPETRMNLDAGEAISGEPGTAHATLAEQWATEAEARAEAKRASEDYEARSELYRLNRAADQLIEARADAIAVFGEGWSADGKSIETIHREIVSARHPEELERLDRLDEQARAPTLRALAAICVAHKGESPLQREDSADEETPDAESARKGMIKRMRDGWKKGRGGSATEPPAVRPESESEEESGDDDSEEELGDGAMARAARAASDTRRTGKR